MIFRRGYTVSFVLIILIIGVACGAFYLKNKSSNYVSLSPESNDGLHLECMNLCGDVSGESICYIRCQYVFGEGPDLCDPLGSVCLMP